VSRAWPRHGELDPDLILLDLHMKGMNGIDTLKAIRDAVSIAAW